MKRKLITSIFIVILVMAAINIYSDSALLVNSDDTINKEITKADYLANPNTLINIDENTSIDLYEEHEILSKPLEKNGFEYTNRDNIKIAFINKKDGKYKLLYELEQFYDPKKLTNIDSLPIYDAIYKDDCFRFIIRRGIYVYVNEIDVQNPDIKRLRDIYQIIWTPFIDIGILKDIEFITPDIIKVSNTKGTVYHAKISESILNGKETLGKELLWWNGMGEKLPLRMLFGGDNVNKIMYNINSGEPTYEENVWNGWYKMDKRRVYNYYEKDTKGYYYDQEIMRTRLSKEKPDKLE